MTKNIGVCKGRHEIPSVTGGYIFSREIPAEMLVNPLALEDEALNNLSNLLSGNTDVNLYVSGLTVAVMATVNACKALGLKVTLMHFNRENGEYYPQEIR
jgi:hypothetical protein